MSDINVCLACDNNYAKYAGVVIASILTNAKQTDNIKILILDGGVDETNKEKISSLSSIKPCEINFVLINEKDFEEYKKVTTHSYITVAAYYRLRLASLLPNIDKIIYFDCDMVVNSSLDELFNINLDDYLIAGVHDINKRALKKNPNYVNSGMLVFNLDKWRKENIEQKLLEYTKTNTDNIKKGDQEIINNCLKDGIKVIDDTWNVQSSNFTNRSSYIKKPNVVHFVSRKKPWHWGSFSYHRDLYFKYLQLTPWKLDAKEYKHWTKDNQIASLMTYIKYRPFFLFRPRFYEALFKTYWGK